MTFPTGWPPRPASGRRSVRVFITGDTTALFSDNGFLFSDVVGANTFTPTPYVRPGDETAVTSFGDATKGGSPAGGRQIPQDAPDFDPAPKPMLWVQSLLVRNRGAYDLAYSFDGVYVHGIVSAGEARKIEDRYEAGIALRWSGIAATGSITTVAGSALIDGETFVIDDGVNPAVTFEFDDNASVVETATLRQVVFGGGDTADDVRDAIIAAITNAPALNITAVSGGAGLVSLTNDLDGFLGNVAVTEAVADAGFLVSGMSGGYGDTGPFEVEGW